MVFIYFLIYLILILLQFDCSAEVEARLNAAAIRWRPLPAGKDSSSSSNSSSSNNNNNSSSSSNSSSNGYLEEVDPGYVDMYLLLADAFIGGNRQAEARRLLQRVLSLPQAQTDAAVGLSVSSRFSLSFCVPFPTSCCLLLSLCLYLGCWGLCPLFLYLLLSPCISLTHRSVSFSLCLFLSLCLSLSVSLPLSLGIPLCPSLPSVSFRYVDFWGLGFRV